MRIDLSSNECRLQLDDLTLYATPYYRFNSQQVDNIPARITQHTAASLAEPPFAIYTALHDSTSISSVGPIQSTPDLDYCVVTTPNGRIVVAIYHHSYPNTLGYLYHSCDDSSSLYSSWPARYSLGSILVPELYRSIHYTPQDAVDALRAHPNFRTQWVEFDSMGNSANTRLIDPCFRLFFGPPWAQASQPGLDSHISAVRSLAYSYARMNAIIRYSFNNALDHPDWNPAAHAPEAHPWSPDSTSYTAFVFLPSLPALESWRAMAESGPRCLAFPQLDRSSWCDKVVGWQSVVATPRPMNGWCTDKCTGDSLRAFNTTGSTLLSRALVASLHGVSNFDLNHPGGFLCPLPSASIAAWESALHSASTASGFTPALSHFRSTIFNPLDKTRWKLDFIPHAALVPVH